MPSPFPERAYVVYLVMNWYPQIVPMTNPAAITVHPIATTAPFATF